MAQYTIELRNIVPRETGQTRNEHLEALRKEIFDFPYPFYNELNRVEFETDFIRHYYMREIGFESPQLFKIMLEDWLIINMPYYNEMFKSEGLIKNPLINVDWTETRITKRDIETEAVDKTNVINGQTVNMEELSTDLSDNFNRNIETDTPDSRLAITTGENGTGVIEYASKIDEQKNKNRNDHQGSQNQYINGNTRGNGEQQGKSTDNYKDEFHVKGTQGMKTESEMLELYRRTLLRLKRDIFEEMGILFMLVY